MRLWWRFWLESRFTACAAAAVTVVGVVALYALIVIGDKIHWFCRRTSWWPARFLDYCAVHVRRVASTLPVCFLQPRDYINGVQLFIGLILLYGSVLIDSFASTDATKVVAPMLNNNLPDGTPSLIPLLFVTIAWCDSRLPRHCVVGYVVEAAG